MITKKENSQSDEINFSEIFLYLWKQKFLIISLSLAFLIAGFVYGILQPKIYKTEVSLRAIPEALFVKHNLYLKKQFEKIFDEELKLNLLSNDNLIEFVEKNNQINEFKAALKKKNIDVREYFKKKIILEKNKYTLSFEKILPGEDFFNDYIMFTKQKTEAMFKEQLISILDSKINYYKQNLKIAEKINLQNPILKSVIEANNGYVIFATEEADALNLTLADEPATLFYDGTKVLSQKLIYLNELKNDVSNLKLNYNFFIDKSSPPYLVSKSISFFLIAGFLIGLSISLILIFIRI